jgi:polar amino acid transport system substrate-binding protein
MRQAAFGVLATIGLTMLGIAATARLDAARAAPALPEGVAASKTLTFCSAISQPPLEFMGAGSQPKGLDVDIGTEIAARLGLKAKWINIPFAGIIPALQAGHCDAILSQLFIKPARLKVIDMVPYMFSNEIVIERAGQPKYDDPHELSGLKAAGVTGTTGALLLQQANDDLKKEGKKPITVIIFPDNTPAMEQLQFGQVDAYAASYEIGRYYFKLEPGKFQAGGSPFFNIQAGIGVGKQNPGLRDAITAELAAMRQDGTYAKIFKKWDLDIDKLH